MLFAIFFAFWRFLEILTLIPAMGILSYFVNGYAKHNLLTPDYILILFIVSVLAVAWAVFTLFSYHRSSHNARFVAFVDLCFVGALIAGVYSLRFISDANCAHVRVGSSYDISFGIFGSAHFNDLHVSVNRTCALLKTAFALGIMNCIFFFFTAILAWIHGDRAADKEDHRRHSSYRETRYREGSHHHHRSGSHHSSRRGSHSHTRSYV
ncbi:hypothetical protein VTK73DRAFT_9622 [Phialemonium thermophilum]|uniref:MARVEL domain-containing protein n=1 Tax=Phialemonium thermophilum TaxID=223376 RepID=A0ABR3XKP0_9PEZI